MVDILYKICYNNIRWYKKERGMKMNDGYVKKEYYLEGQFKTEYYEDGQLKKEEWYKNGVLHRENGPAVVNYWLGKKKYLEEWYKGGQLHREDGPALVEYNEEGQKITEEYYLNGEKVEKEDLP